MNARDEADLDTWLAEVELAKDYISKLSNNEISVKKFDEEQKIKKEKKEKQETIQRMKVEDAQQKKKEGRPGKGEQKNYSHFCRTCFWEYELPTPTCLRCDKETQTQEARYNELIQKVEKYKKEKVSRQERQKKWDLWKKTQSMLWKKTSNNYSKWDYFTDSEEEEETNKEPILPKNDPNFIAMEQDLEKRKQKIAKDQKAADVLKEEGNNHMKQKNYHKAIESYSDALDIKKDFKVLYTNRALAYIKVFKFQEAIQDCTKLLDYCECFENGYTQSKDLTYKAFLRRALAHKELKNYQQSMSDVNEALKLDSDSSAKTLKEELTQIQDMQKKDAELKEKTTIEEKINEFLKLEPTRENFVALVVYLQTEESAKLYFQKNFGIKTIMTYLKDNKPCYLLLNIFLDQNPVFQEQFVRQKGIELLLSKAVTAHETEDQSEIFENLTTLSLYDIPRQYMQNLAPLLSFVQNKEQLETLFKQHENYPENVGSFLNCLANLCFGGLSKVKQAIMDKFSMYQRFFVTLLENKKKRALLMKQNLCNLLSNLMTDKEIRKSLDSSLVIALMGRLQKLDYKDSRFVANAEALLGTFVNYLHEQIPENVKIANDLHLPLKVKQVFANLDCDKDFQKETVNRALNVLSKLQNNFDYSFMQKIISLMDKKYLTSGFPSHCIRILAKMFVNPEVAKELQSRMTEEHAKDLVKKLLVFMHQEDETLFCNSCNLSGSFVQVMSSILGEYRSVIPRLITIIRDTTGLKRKNAAIFLARLAKNPENLDVIRKLHGIEILHNVQKFIV